MLNGFGPPDILVGGIGFAAILSSFFLFSPSNLLALWKELNHIRPHGRNSEVSAIWKCMSKIYVFGTQQDIDNRAIAMQTTRGVLQHLETT